MIDNNRSLELKLQEVVSHVEDDEKEDKSVSNVLLMNKRMDNMTRCYFSSYEDHEMNEFVLMQSDNDQEKNKDSHACQQDSHACHDHPVQHHEHILCADEQVLESLENFSSLSNHSSSARSILSSFYDCTRSSCTSSSCRDSCASKSVESRSSSVDCTKPVMIKRCESCEGRWSCSSEEQEYLCKCKRNCVFLASATDCPAHDNKKHACVNSKRAPLKKQDFHSNDTSSRCTMMVRHPLEDQVLVTDCCEIEIAQQEHAEWEQQVFYNNNKENSVANCCWRDKKRMKRCYCVKISKTSDHHVSNSVACYSQVRVNLRIHSDPETIRLFFLGSKELLAKKNAHNGMWFMLFVYINQSGHECSEENNNKCCSSCECSREIYMMERECERVLSRITYIYQHQHHHDDEDMRKSSSCDKIYWPFSHCIMPIHISPISCCSTQEEDTCLKYEFNYPIRHLLPCFASRLSSRMLVLRKNECLYCAFYTNDEQMNGFSISFDWSLAIYSNHLT